MVDFSKDYWMRVFEPCVGVWENGGTPNPDVMCNSYVTKFQVRGTWLMYQ